MILQGIERMILLVLDCLMREGILGAKSSRTLTLIEGWQKDGTMAIPRALHASIAIVAIKERDNGTKKSTG